jgi:septum formation protein
LSRAAATGPDAMKVVLASKSPQRHALLEALGIEFEVQPAQIEELTEGEPEEIVLENARWKAAAASANVRPDTLVIGGDTEVFLDGKSLGQPKDEAAAREHLERLSGREHEVLGGLALLGPNEEDGRLRTREGVASSTVQFRELEPTVLDAYLASGEWEGRAGSYAIQGLGSALVESVRGDVSNVIGLPLPLLFRLAPELFQSA